MINYRFPDAGKTMKPITMRNSEYPPEGLDVLCYFIDHQISSTEITCRVGRYDNELGFWKWHIHADGRERFLHDIIEWKYIPNILPA